MQSRLVSQLPRSLSDVASGSPSVQPQHVGPAINTILAVREHAPAEIDELEAQIKTLHHRLGVAYARKHLLERLLDVIREADGIPPVSQPGMAIVR